MLEDVHVSQYNGKNLTELLEPARARISGPNLRDLAMNRIQGYPMLVTLQESTAQLNDFEFFEEIQQVPLSSVYGSSNKFTAFVLHYNLMLFFFLNSRRNSSDPALPHTNKATGR